LDATCAPADISYPTDLELLNQARKHTEQIIDSLYEQIKGQLEKKTRTYRDIARRDYLEVAKRRTSFKRESNQLGQSILLLQMLPKLDIILLPIFLN